MPHDLIDDLSNLKDKDKFELFDGGHCYLRAIKDRDGKISLHRFPTRVNPADVALLGQWANLLLTEKSVATMTVSCDESVSAKTAGGKGVRLGKQQKRIRVLMRIEEVYSDHIVVSRGENALAVPLTDIAIDARNRLSPGCHISAYINPDTSMDHIVVER